MLVSLLTLTNQSLPAGGLVLAVGQATAQNVFVAVSLWVRMPVLLSALFKRATLRWVRWPVQAIRFWASPTTRLSAILHPSTLLMAIVICVLVRLPKRLIQTVS